MLVHEGIKEKFVAAESQGKDAHQGPGQVAHRAIVFGPGGAQAGGLLGPQIGREMRPGARHEVGAG